MIYCFDEIRNSSILTPMKTIVIANQKGGSGKSTTTVHLAVAAEQAGDGPVVISDIDPQGSTADWFNVRMKAGIESPRYAPLALSGLADYLAALKNAGVGYLFIDTAPAMGGVNPELFAIADLVLIPLNPTATDLRALVKGLPIIRQSGKPFNFLLARVRPNLRSNDSIAMALESLGLVIPARMHERVIYAESFGHGKTAFEIDPKGIAVQELASIWNDVREKIRGNEKSAKREAKQERIHA
jgi:chromosome partitioning protein